MNIALFGATGFVGNYIINSLIKNHHTPFALVREGSEKKLRTNINIIPGDLNNVDSINKLVSQVDAVIYNIGTDFLNILCSNCLATAVVL